MNCCQKLMLPSSSIFLTLRFIFSHVIASILLRKIPFYIRFIYFFLKYNFVVFNTYDTILASALFVSDDGHSLREQRRRHGTDEKWAGAIRGQR